MRGSHPGVSRRSQSHVYGKPAGHADSRCVAEGKQGPSCGRLQEQRQIGSDDGKREKLVTQTAGLKKAFGIPRFIVPVRPLNNIQ